MSTFDAGAVEARLTLDRSAFTKGIAAARAQAKRLDGMEIEIALQLSGLDDLIALESLIEGMDNERIRIDAEVTDNALDELATLQAMVQSVDAANVDISTDADVANSLVDLEILEAQVNDLDNEIINIHTRVWGNDGKPLDDTNMGQGGIRFFQLLIVGLIALLPVLTSAAGVAAGALVGIGTALLAAGAAGGVFAVGMVAAIGRIEELRALGAEAPQWFIHFEESLERLKGTWDAFGEAVSPAAFTVMAQAFEVVNLVLPQMVPIFDAVAGVVLELLVNLTQFFQTQEWASMLEYIGGFGATAFGKLLEIVGQLIGFFINLGIAFEPLATSMINGLDRIVEGWNDWAMSLQGTDKMTEFMAWVAERGGQVWDLLRAIGEAFINIGVALDPAAEVMLLALTDFFNAIAEMDPNLLGPLVLGMVGLLAATQVLGPVLGAISAIGGIAGALGLAGITAGVAAVAALAAIFGGLVAAITLTTDTGAPFKDMWDQLKSTWETLKAEGAEIGEVIGNLMDKIAQSDIITNFQTGFQMMAEVFQMLAPYLSDIAYIIGEVLFIALSIASEIFVGTATSVNGFIGAIITAWNTVINFAQAIGINFNAIGNVIGTVIGFVTGVLGGWIGFIVSLPGRIAATVSTWFSNAGNIVSTVIGVLKGMWDGFVGWINGIKDRFSFSGMFDGIKDAFKSAINSVISAWNGLSFTIPSADAFGVTIGGGTISTPDIKPLAEGGLVTGPTFALIGEGKESEAVLPLSDLRAMLENERSYADPTMYDNRRDYPADDLLTLRLVESVEELLAEIRNLADKTPIEYNDYGQRRDVGSIAEDLWLLERERG